MNPLEMRNLIRSFLISATIFLALSGCAGHSDDLSSVPYHHLVVLGDPHLPGRDIDKKVQVLENINSWEDVEMVIAVGDICSFFGTDDEYQAAREYFDKLHAPLFPIAGNHDYFYAHPADSGGQLVAGSRAWQEERLQKFKDTFGLSNYYYSRHVGDYLLIFLSADHTEFLSGMSDQQIDWLRKELANNKQTPTIIIFHGPLQNTLRSYRHWVNTPSFIAQPVETLHAILEDNHQVFLWVSGHVHTSPLEESYASPINLYAGRVTNIHNKDMNRGTIWTNSLYLYHDKVVVKTYNHEEKQHVPHLERIVVPPEL